VIGPDALPLPDPDPGTLETPGSTLQVSVGSSISDVERRLILAPFDEFGGDKKHAAKVLEIGLKTLYNRLNVYEAARRADP
jgi:DNA-binding NtrC family response regulator